jgi:hypothetical protein
VIHVIFDQFPGTVKALVHEPGVLHLLCAQPTGVVLLPHQETQLIAQVEEPAIVGIVRGSYSVGAKITNPFQVIHHGLDRKGASVVRMILVTIHSLDMKWATVQEQKIWQPLQVLQRLLN